MEDILNQLFMNSRDAVLSVANKIIVYANAAAEELFGNSLCGRRADVVLPRDIEGIDYDGRAAICIRGQHCTVSVTRLETSLVYQFTPEMPHRDGAPISPATLSSMLGTLCNIGLAIDQTVSLAPSGIRPAKFDQAVSILRHNYYALKRTVENLNTTSSLRDGSARFLPRSVDLVAVCKELTDSVSTLLKPNYDIRFFSDCKALFIQADPDRIEQLLLNLLSNAALHLPQGGSATVSLSVSGERAILSVDDTGSGIAPHIFKDIFSRSEVPFSGCLDELPTAGLGLGIARGIAELHGGALIIESREGAGTHVRVSLPLDSPDSGSLAAVESAYSTHSMDRILTELSPLLDSSFYTDRFID